LDQSPPKAGDQIYIPQHPSARAKEIAIQDNSAPNFKCSIKGYSDGACRSRHYQDVQYTCDTAGGSSGAPVLSSDSHKIVAIHHCGGGCKGNMGIPSHVLYNILAPHIGAQKNKCSSDEHLFEVSLMTDQYPDETSWELRDKKNNKLMAKEDDFGGKDGVTFLQSVCLPAGKQYEFRMRDSAGDGIQQDGHYTVFLNGYIIREGNSFGTVQTTSFGTPELQVTNDNPTPNTFANGNDQCFDDPKWFFVNKNGKKRRCDFVAKKRKKCKKVGRKGEKARNACPEACRKCK